MACAGLIGIGHKNILQPPPPMNESGLFSMAPHTMIMPVKIFREDVLFPDLDMIGSAINWTWKEGADILSCSWGFYGDYSYAYDVIMFAIDSAYHFGRDGKGCPVMFSSGNYAQWAPGYLFFPANIPSTFAVGASDLDDQRWNYSQYGNALSAVAPSGSILPSSDRIWSIDQMDDAGYNPNAYLYYDPWQCTPSTNDENYNCQFGGTSASTAIVAGMAALVLSYNDTLTSN